MTHESDQPVSPHDDSLRIGVCGFCLPQADLFARFQLMEVQQTFYKPPQLKTVERWRRTAPPDFEFTLNAFQAITHTINPKTYRRTNLTADEQAQCGHFRDTPVVREAWTTTRTLARAMEASCVVFQCPPGFHATEDNQRNLRKFYDWADRGGLTFVWEPRHDTWTPELIGDLCSELDLVHAVDPLERPSVRGAPAYYRLHGRSLGRFRYNYNYPYNDDELAEVRRRVDSPAWVLFNNIQMATDAERFARLG
jgi:uncharacterized protein YecE (DUF72 family)